MNLGYGSVSSNLKIIVQSTGGEVYNSVSAVDLTYRRERRFILRFEGVDSDGDGIPDLVELYGLKPDGHPINTDPFKKDTDGDGLDDNIELNFVTEKLTSTVSMVEYYSAIGYSSDPTMPDTDSDNVDDYLESLLGTNPNSKDTDSDGLSDGKEVQLWFDPLNPNPDGDSFNDYEEYINGTDPFSYDLTGFEWDSRFIKGIVLGDFIECNDIPTLLGQITGGFIPGYADIRDVIANARKGEWDYAVISGIGLVPLAGDAAKIASALEDFVLKHLDDAPTIASALLKVSEQVPDVLKYLPGSSLDNIANSLKNGKQFSKSEYTKLKEMFAAAGKNLDDLFDDMLGDLNWNAVISSKGETRIDHILKHTIPAPNRVSHGVFNGNAVEMVNTAWRNRSAVNAIDDGMGCSVYNIPYINAGYESGLTNTGEVLNYVTIITKHGTNELISAFPTNGIYPK